jgi:hypothetical protein
MGGNDGSPAISPEAGRIAVGTPHTKLLSRRPYEYQRRTMLGGTRVQPLGGLLSGHVCGNHV